MWIFVKSVQKVDYGLEKIWLNFGVIWNILDTSRSCKCICHLTASFAAGFALERGHVGLLRMCAANCMAIELLVQRPITTLLISLATGVNLAKYWKGRSRSIWDCGRPTTPRTAKGRVGVSMWGSLIGLCGRLCLDSLEWRVKIVGYEKKWIFWNM